MKFAISNLHSSSACLSEIMAENHYSWSIVARLFKAALSECNLEHTELKEPHAVNKRNLNMYGLDSGDIHLSFRPREHIRLCKPIKNIAHLAWEFPSLQSDNVYELCSKYPGSPFNHGIPNVLRKFEHIWVGSAFAMQAYKNKGLNNVRVVPAPICSIKDQIPFYQKPDSYHYSRRARLSLYIIKAARDIKASLYPLNYLGHRFSNIQSALDVEPQSFDTLLLNSKKQGGVIVGLVANPHDRRKNILNAIRGFLMALPALPNGSILILKLSCRESFNDMYHSVYSWLFNTHAINAPSVYVTTDFIETDSMPFFYAALDYYLCTSYCEGQNLPLLEAMSRGTIPISVNSTAMADYISASNAFVIPSFSSRVNSRIHPDRFYWGLEWFDTRPVDIATTITEAAHADKKKLELMSKLNTQIVKDKYSYQAIASLIKSNIANIDSN